MWRELVAVLAAALSLWAVVPTIASARPRARGRLTLTLPAGPLLSGDAVLLRGRLHAPRHAGRVVIVLERLPGHRRFARVGRTRTDARGLWSLLRSPGRVLTNRLVEATAGGVLTRTAMLSVQAELSLAAPAVIQPPGPTVDLTGTLTPREPGARIAAEQLSPGGRWLALRVGHADSNSRFSLRASFPEAGQATVRVRFAGDRRAQAAASTPISMLVEQAPLGTVSLMADNNPVVGGSATGAAAPTVGLSGTVPGPTGARRLVTLFARPATGGDYPPVDTTTTDAWGAFAFLASLTHTTAYAVRAADGGLSGQVIVGVLPTITVVVPAPAPRAGTRVVMNGTMSPPIGGLPAELERQGGDGAFHTVGHGQVAADGTFAVAASVGAPGLEQLRVLITGNNRALVSTSAASAVTVGPELGGGG